MLAGSWTSTGKKVQECELTTDGLQVGRNCNFSVAYYLRVLEGCGVGG